MKVSKNQLYHMIFAGPPGTGKTTMARLVAKIMLHMDLLETHNVVFVDNALDLVAGYVGHTSKKVDAKVAEAKGGVLFIDEAYSIVKDKSGGGSGSSKFGTEAIETIMKHMDPPSCVFILAGYGEEMDRFLDVNDGLKRRIPFRFQFDPYSIDELKQILSIMATAQGEIVASDVMDKIVTMLASLDNDQLKEQNAGVVRNWLAFAKLNRDDRLDIDDAIENPQLACTLNLEDFEQSLAKVKKTK